MTALYRYVKPANIKKNTVTTFKKSKNHGKPLEKNHGLR